MALDRPAIDGIRAERELLSPLQRWADLVIDTTDLSVTDLRMPEVDGFALLAHISRNYPFLPTIVMTAFSSPEIEDHVSGK
ncbi:MAG: hypothetical protein RLZZ604_1003, partial [Pseudomonadota bacterium]